MSMIRQHSPGAREYLRQTCADFPTEQGHLFLPMCGRSVARQGELFPGQGEPEPAAEVHPDCEGQQMLPLDVPGFWDAFPEA